MPESPVPLYTISDVSDRLGFTYRTLHYYEEKLSLNINRNSSGDRIYSEKDVHLLEIVKDLKAKGMKLDGIRKFLIEKCMLEPESNSLKLLNDYEYQRALLTNELKKVFIEEIQAVSNEISKLREENEHFREEINSFVRQTDDHYSKIDRYITQWRERKKFPWFRKLFK